MAYNAYVGSPVWAGGISLSNLSLNTIPKGLSMKKSSISVFAVALSVAASYASAHSGHGLIPASSLAHYLIEPLHSLQAFVPLACVAVTVWWLRRGPG